jgi:hypothetical protein
MRLGCIMISRNFQPLDVTALASAALEKMGCHTTLRVNEIAIALEHGSLSFWQQYLAGWGRQRRWILLQHQ